jgi:hypothetical protein
MFSDSLQSLKQFVTEESMEISQKAAFLLAVLYDGYYAPLAK